MKLITFLFKQNKQCYLFTNKKKKKKKRKKNTVDIGKHALNFFAKHEIMLLNWQYGT